MSVINPRGFFRARLAVCVLILSAIFCTTATPVLAASLPFSTNQSFPYLIVATERINGNTDVATNNFELGANKAPVPADTDFVDNNGGPTLLGAVPNLPASGIQTVFQGIGGHGNIAVTDDEGEFEFQDVGIYADPSIGIRVAAPNDSFNKSSNTFFNDPNMFPNTFTPTGPTGTGGNLGGFGTDVNPNDADQNTRVDPTGQGNPSANVGVTFNFDHSALLAELAAARTSINTLFLSPTNVLDVSGGNSGELENSSTITGAGNGNGSATLTDGPVNSIGGVTQTLTLPAGLSIIEIETDENTFLLNNANFIIDGPEGATVIFKVEGTENMSAQNSNILLGDGGIGRNDVLFYTDQVENDTHFAFSNSIINGAAFWSLGDNGGGIDVSNAQGSTQFIADIVDMDDVRFTRWSFGIPEPTGAVLMIAALAGLAVRR